ncbi:MAG: hypothetical protein HGA99_05920 [Chlorobiaceae bacterium]|nr:hypothetical protein [Chlorobiaceae bacterium]
MNWLLDNKQWLFSGVGLGIVGLIGRLFYNKQQKTSSQTIRSGNNSTNFQAGNDINIGTRTKGKDVEKK